MIRNNSQLARAQEILQRYQIQIQGIQEKYSGVELEMLALPIQEEAVRLENEIQEYELLNTLPFENAVNGILKKPVILEQISDLLTKLRIAAGLSQEELASSMGWKQSNISRFENPNYNSHTIAKVIEYAFNLGIQFKVFPTLVESSDLSFETSNIKYEIAKSKDPNEDQVTTESTPLLNEDETESLSRIFFSNIDIKPTQSLTYA